MTSPMVFGESVNFITPKAYFFWVTVLNPINEAGIEAHMMRAIYGEGLRRNGLKHNRRQVSPIRFVVEAHRHQGHLLDNAQSTFKAPAK